MSSPWSFAGKLPFAFELFPSVWAVVTRFKEASQNVVLVFVHCFVAGKAEVAETLYHCFVVVWIVEVSTKVAKDGDIFGEIIYSKTVVQRTNTVNSKWLEISVFAECFVAIVFALQKVVVAHHQEYKDVLEDVKYLIFVSLALVSAEINEHVFVFYISVGKQVLCLCVVLGWSKFCSAIPSKVAKINHVDGFF